MDDDEINIDDAYMNGWRVGMFHKCNGKPDRNFSGCETNVYNRIYIDGYDDGFAGNEVRI